MPLNSKKCSRVSDSPQSQLTEGAEGGMRQLCWELLQRIIAQITVQLSFLGSSSSLVCLSAFHCTDSVLSYLCRDNMSVDFNTGQPPADEEICSKQTTFAYITHKDLCQSVSQRQRISRDFIVLVFPVRIAVLLPISRSAAQACTSQLQNTCLMRTGSVPKQTSGWRSCSNI